MATSEPTGQLIGRERKCPSYGVFERVRPTRQTAPAIQPIGWPPTHPDARRVDTAS
jgi:hypothetical protein